MGHCVLDACALVNLHCGWGGLTELRGFGDSWRIGDIALAEAMFVRKFDASGGVCKLTLNVAEVVAQGNLHVVSLDTTPGNADAQTSFVEFAMELDDGEAQALAIALHRNCVLVTDDRLAIRMASGLSAAVPTMGTPEILMAWAHENPGRQARLPDVVRRIAVLGPFQLKRTSRHYGWWQGLLSQL